MRTAVLLAHSDPYGLVAPHVLHHLGALAGVARRVVVVTSSPLRPEAAEQLASRAEVVREPSALGEWALWRRGLEHLGDWEGLDRLVLTDEVVVGPLRPLPQVLGAPVPGALRGVTAAGPHLSRHLLDVGAHVLRSSAFRAFWTGVGDGLGALASPELAERNLSRAVSASGRQVSPIFRPSSRDRLRARARVTRRDLGKVVTTSGPRRSEALGSLRRPPVRLLDPAAAWWYRALDGSLPYVRTDVLAEDPERVGTGTMLRSLEQAHPVAMAGVREHLRRAEGGRPVRAARGRGAA